MRAVGAVEVQLVPAALVVQVEVARVVLDRGLGLLALPTQGVAGAVVGPTQHQLVPQAAQA